MAFFNEDEEYNSLDTLFGSNEDNLTFDEKVKRNRAKQEEELDKLFYSQRRGPIIAPPAVPRIQTTPPRSFDYKAFSEQISKQAAQQVKTQQPAPTVSSWQTQELPNGPIDMYKTRLGTFSMVSGKTADAFDFTTTDDKDWEKAVNAGFYNPSPLGSDGKPYLPSHDFFVPNSSRFTPGQFTTELTERLKNRDLTDMWVDERTPIGAVESDDTTRRSKVVNPHIADTVWEYDRDTKTTKLNRTFSMTLRVDNFLSYGAPQKNKEGQLVYPTTYKFSDDYVKYTEKLNSEYGDDVDTIASEQIKFRGDELYKYYTKKMLERLKALGQPVSDDLDAIVEAALATTKNVRNQISANRRKILEEKLQEGFTIDLNDQKISPAIYDEVSKALANLKTTGADGKSTNISFKDALKEFNKKDLTADLSSAVRSILRKYGYSELADRKDNDGKFVASADVLGTMGSMRDRAANSAEVKKKLALNALKQKLLSYGFDPSGISEEYLWTMVNKGEESIEDGKLTITKDNINVVLTILEEQQKKYGVLPDISQMAAGNAISKYRENGKLYAQFSNEELYDVIAAYSLAEAQSRPGTTREQKIASAIKYAGTLREENSKLFSADLYENDEELKRVKDIAEKTKKGQYSETRVVRLGNTVFQVKEAIARPLRGMAYTVGDIGLGIEEGLDTVGLNLYDNWQETGDDFESYFDSKGTTERAKGIALKQLAKSLGLTIKTESTSNYSGELEIADTIKDTYFNEDGSAVNPETMKWLRSYIQSMYQPVQEGRDRIESEWVTNQYLSTHALAKTISYLEEFVTSYYDVGYSKDFGEYKAEVGVTDVSVNDVLSYLEQKRQWKENWLIEHGVTDAYVGSAIAGIAPAFIPGIGMWWLPISLIGGTYGLPAWKRAAMLGIGLATMGLSKYGLQQAIAGKIATSSTLALEGTEALLNAELALGRTTLVAAEGMSQLRAKLLTAGTSFGGGGLNTLLNLDSMRDSEGNLLWGQVLGNVLTDAIMFGATDYKQISAVGESQLTARNNFLEVVDTVDVDGNLNKTSSYWILMQDPLGQQPSYKRITPEGFEIAKAELAKTNEKPNLIHTTVEGLRQFKTLEDSHTTNLFRALIGQDNPKNFLRRWTSNLIERTTGVTGVVKFDQSAMIAPSKYTKLDGKRVRLFTIDELDGEQKVTLSPEEYSERRTEILKVAHDNENNILLHLGDEIYFSTIARMVKEGDLTIGKLGNMSLTKQGKTAHLEELKSLVKLKNELKKGEKTAKASAKVKEIEEQDKEDTTNGDIVTRILANKADQTKKTDALAWNVIDYADNKGKGKSLPNVLRRAKARLAATNETLARTKFWLDTALGRTDVDGLDHIFSAKMAHDSDMTRGLTLSRLLHMSPAEMDIIMHGIEQGNLKLVGDKIMTPDQLAAHNGKFYNFGTDGIGYIERALFNIGRKISLDDETYRGDLVQFAEGLGISDSISQTKLADYATNTFNKHTAKPSKLATLLSFENSGRQEIKIRTSENSEFMRAIEDKTPIPEGDVRDFIAPELYGQADHDVPIASEGRVEGTLNRFQSTRTKTEDGSTTIIYYREFDESNKVVKTGANGPKVTAENLLKSADFDSNTTKLLEQFTGDSTKQFTVTKIVHGEDGSITISAKLKEDGPTIFLTGKKLQLFGSGKLDSFRRSAQAQFVVAKHNLTIERTQLNPDAFVWSKLAPESPLKDVVYLKTKDGQMVEFVRTSDGTFITKYGKYGVSEASLRKLVTGEDSLAEIGILKELDQNAENYRIAKFEEESEAFKSTLSPEDLERLKVTYLKPDQQVNNERTIRAGKGVFWVDSETAIDFNIYSSGKWSGQADGHFELTKSGDVAVTNRRMHDILARVVEGENAGKGVHGFVINAMNTRRVEGYLRSLEELKPTLTEAEYTSTKNLITDLRDGDTKVLAVARLDAEFLRSLELESQGSKFYSTVRHELIHANLIKAWVAKYPDSDTDFFTHADVKKALMDLTENDAVKSYIDLMATKEGHYGNFARGVNTRLGVHYNSLYGTIHELLAHASSKTSLESGLNLKTPEEVRVYEQAFVEVIKTLKNLEDTLGVSVVDQLKAYSDPEISKLVEAKQDANRLDADSGVRTNDEGLTRGRGNIEDIRKTSGPGRDFIERQNEGKVRGTGVRAALEERAQGVALMSRDASRLSIVDQDRNIMLTKGEYDANAKAHTDGTGKLRLTGGVELDLDSGRWSPDADADFVRDSVDRAVFVPNRKSIGLLTDLGDYTGRNGITDVNVRMKNDMLAAMQFPSTEYFAIQKAQQLAYHLSTNSDLVQAYGPKNVDNLVHFLETVSGENLQYLLKPRTGTEMKALLNNRNPGVLLPYNPRMPYDVHRFSMFHEFTHRAVTEIFGTSMADFLAFRNAKILNDPVFQKFSARLDSLPDITPGVKHPYSKLSLENKLQELAATPADLGGMAELGYKATLEDLLEFTQVHGKLIHSIAETLGPVEARRIVRLLDPDYYDTVKKLYGEAYPQLEAVGSRRRVGFTNDGARLLSIDTGQIDATNAREYAAEAESIYRRTVELKQDFDAKSKSYSRKILIDGLDFDNSNLPKEVIDAIQDVTNLKYDYAGGNKNIAPVTPIQIRAEIGERYGKLKNLADISLKKTTDRLGKPAEDVWPMRDYDVHFHRPMKAEVRDHLTGPDAGKIIINVAKNVPEMAELNGREVTSVQEGLDLITNAQMKIDQVSVNKYGSIIDWAKTDFKVQEVWTPRRNSNTAVTPENGITKLLSKDVPVSETEFLNSKPFNNLKQLLIKMESPIGAETTTTSFEALKSYLRAKSSGAWDERVSDVLDTNYARRIAAGLVNPKMMEGVRVNGISEKAAFVLNGVKINGKTLDDVSVPAIIKDTVAEILLNDAQFAEPYPGGNVDMLYPVGRYELSGAIAEPMYTRNTEGELSWRGWEEGTLEKSQKDLKAIVFGALAQKKSNPDAEAAIAWVADNDLNVKVPNEGVSYTVPKNAERMFGETIKKATEIFPEFEQILMGHHDNYLANLREKNLSAANDGYNQSRAEGPPLFARDISKPIFNFSHIGADKTYSNITAFLDGIDPITGNAHKKNLPETAKAKDWKNILIKASGVKQAEMYWSGMTHLLDANPDATFTRQQLIESAEKSRIRTSQVKLTNETSQYGKYSFLKDSDLYTEGLVQIPRLQIGKAQPFAESDLPPYHTIKTFTEDGPNGVTKYAVVRAQTASTWERVGELHPSIDLAVNSFMADTTPALRDSHFSTVPAKDNIMVWHRTSFKNVPEHGRFGLIEEIQRPKGPGDGNPIDNVLLEMEAVNRKINNLHIELYEKYNSRTDFHISGEMKADINLVLQENVDMILGHLKKYPDDDIQSLKVIQRPKATLEAALGAEYKNIHGETVSKDMFGLEWLKWSQEVKEIQNRLANAETERNQIRKDFGNWPETPFDKNWHEVGTKYAIINAIDNGAEFIAVTNPGMQSARWDMGGTVDRVVFKRGSMGIELPMTTEQFTRLSAALDFGSPDHVQFHDDVLAYTSRNLARSFKQEAARRIVELFEKYKDVDFDAAMEKKARLAAEATLKSESLLKQYDSLTEEFNAQWAKEQEASPNWKKGIDWTGSAYSNWRRDAMDKAASEYKFRQTGERMYKTAIPPSEELIAIAGKQFDLRDSLTKVLDDKTIFTQDLNFTNNWAKQYSEMLNQVKVEAWRNGTIIHEADLFLNKPNADGHTLEDYVGRDLAKQARESNEMSYVATGDNLSVGVNSFRRLYGEKIPKAMEKFAKMYGVELETVNIKASEKQTRGQESVVGFKVTPEMKENPVISLFARDHTSAIEDTHAKTIRDISAKMPKDVTAEDVDYVISKGHFATLSAFRSGVDAEANFAAHKALVQRLKSEGLKFIETRGRFTEGDSQIAELGVIVYHHDDSFMAPLMFITRDPNGLNQSALMVGSKGTHAMYNFADNTVIKSNKFSIGSDYDSDQLGVVPAGQHADGTYFTVNGKPKSFETDFGPDSGATTSKFNPENIEKSVGEYLNIKTLSASLLDSGIELGNFRAMMDGFVNRQETDRFGQVVPDGTYLDMNRVQVGSVVSRDANGRATAWKPFDTVEMRRKYPGLFEGDYGDGPPKTLPTEWTMLRKTYKTETDQYALLPADTPVTVSGKRIGTPKATKGDDAFGATRFYEANTGKSPNLPDALTIFMLQEGIRSANKSKGIDIGLPVPKPKARASAAEWKEYNDWIARKTALQVATAKQSVLRHMAANENQIRPLFYHDGADAYRQSLGLTYQEYNNSLGRIYTDLVTALSSQNTEISRNAMNTFNILGQAVLFGETGNLFSASNIRDLATGKNIGFFDKKTRKWKDSTSIGSGAPAMAKLALMAEGYLFYDQSQVKVTLPNGKVTSLDKIPVSKRTPEIMKSLAEDGWIQAKDKLSTEAFDPTSLDGWFKIDSNLKQRVDANGSLLGVLDYLLEVPSGQDLPRAVDVFGVKIGQFFLNMSKLPHPVTIDVWMQKYFDTISGEAVTTTKDPKTGIITTLEKNYGGGLTERENSPYVGVVQKVAAELSAELGKPVDPYDIQQVLWDEIKNSTYEFMDQSLSSVNRSSTYIEGLNAAKESAMANEKVNVLDRSKVIPSNKTTDDHLAALPENIRSLLTGEMKNVGYAYARNQGEVGLFSMDRTSLAAQQHILNLSEQALVDGDVDAWMSAAERIVAPTKNPHSAMSRLAETERATIKMLAEKGDIENLQKYVLGLAKQHPLELLVNFGRVALLLGARNIVKNALGNTVRQAMDEIIRVPATVLDTVFIQMNKAMGGQNLEKSITSLLSNPLDTLSAYKKALGKSITEGGKSFLDVMKGDDEAVVFEHPSLFRERTTGWKLLKPFEIIERYGWRLQGAMDRPFNTAAFHRALHELQTMRMNEQIKAGNKISFDEAENHLTPGDIQLAEEHALVATYQKQNAIANRYYSFVDGLPPTWRAVITNITKFVKTPLNVMDYVLDYTGFWPIAKMAHREYNTKDWVSWKDSVKKVMDNPQDRKTLSMALSQGAIGTVMMHIGYKMAEAGMLSAFFKREEKKEQEQMEAKGTSWGKVNIGGRSIDISWIAPNAYWLISGATMFQSRDEWAQKKDELDAEMAKAQETGNAEKIASLNQEIIKHGKKGPNEEFLTRMIKNFALQTPFLRQMQDVVEAWNGDSMLSDLGGRWVAPESYVPAIVKEIAQGMDDMERVVTDESFAKTAIDKIARNVPTIPGITDIGDMMARTELPVISQVGKILQGREKLPVKYDMFGRPIPTATGLSGPFGAVPLTEDKLTTEFDRLNVSITTPKGGTSIETNRLVKEKGDVFRPMLEQVINSAQYEQMDDTYKKRTLEYVLRGLTTELKTDKLQPQEEQFNINMVLNRELFKYQLRSNPDQFVKPTTVSDKELVKLFVGAGVDNTISMKQVLESVKRGGFDKFIDDKFSFDLMVTNRRGLEDAQERYNNFLQDPQYYLVKWYISDLKAKQGRERSQSIEAELKAKGYTKAQIEKEKHRRAAMRGVTTRRAMKNAGSVTITYE